jgi:hypothetical protein
MNRCEFAGDGNDVDGATDWREGAVYLELEACLSGLQHRTPGIGR